MHDLAPTILDMADVSTNSVDVELDGRSVLPSRRNDGDFNRTLLLDQADLPIDPEDGGDTRYAAPRSVEEADWVYHAAVTRRWRLIEWDQLGVRDVRPAR